MNNVRFHNRERYLILIEYIRYRELTAVSIATVFEVHFTDFIGVCLHENRYACILQCCNRAVFINKDRHAENNAVILAFMTLEPVVIQSTFIACFNRAITGCVFIHNKNFMTGIRNSLYHICSRACDKFCGHKAAVTKKQCKFHFN